jgi:hypothetical protein
MTCDQDPEIFLAGRLVFGVPHSSAIYLLFHITSYCKCSLQKSSGILARNKLLHTQQSFSHLQ